MVPFQINPHYYGKIRFSDGDVEHEHFGESRSQRISEFHVHWKTPVLGMWEGSFVFWNGESGLLYGRATAFRKEEEPANLYNGHVFDSDLRTIE